MQTPEFATHFSRFGQTFSIAVTNISFGTRQHSPHITASKGFQEYRFSVRYFQKKKSNGIKSGHFGGHSAFPRCPITRPGNALERHFCVIIVKLNGVPTYLKSTISASSQTDIIDWKVQILLIAEVGCLRHTVQIPKLHEIQNSLVRQAVDETKDIIEIEISNFERWGIS